MMFSKFLAVRQSAFFVFIIINSLNNASSAATPLKNPNLSRLDVAQFAVGLVGFAGHISDAEDALHDIVADVDSEHPLLMLAQDKSASPVARLYALCGLKIIDSTYYQGALMRIQKLSGFVSTMHGDILQVEYVNTVANNIDSNLCNRRK